MTNSRKDRMRFMKSTRAEVEVLFGIKGLARWEQDDHEQCQRADTESVRETLGLREDWNHAYPDLSWEQGVRQLELEFGDINEMPPNPALRFFDLFRRKPPGTTLIAKAFSPISCVASDPTSPVG
jgi:hypothetical protein